MNNFGFLGGGKLYELGSRFYVQSFFLAFERYPLSVELYRRLDWSLITDRLYRRIVPDDRLDEAIGTLARMLHLLRETKLAEVDWAALGLSGPEEGPAFQPMPPCATSTCPSRMASRLALPA